MSVTHDMTGLTDWTDESTDSTPSSVSISSEGENLQSGLPWPPQSYAAPPTLEDLSRASELDDGLEQSQMQELGVFMCTAMVKLETVLGCGVIPVLCILGAVGNCLCVVVFLRQRYHSVVKPLLLAMCVSDVLFLLCSFLVLVPKLVSQTDGEEARTLQVMFTPQLVVLRDVMGRVTVVLTLAIGVERSVTVTRPFKMRGLCTTPRTRTAVLAIYIAVLALMAPLFFRYGVTHQHVLPDNVTRPVLHKTHFYLDNRIAMDFYAHYLLAAFLRLLPFIGMGVCFAVILVSLKRRLQCRTGQPQAPKHGAFARARGGAHSHMDESAHADLVLEERKLTRALLAVLLICILCEVLGLGARFTHVVQPGIKASERCGSAYLAAYDIGDLMEVMNSAVNFPVFMLTYKHFSVTFSSLTGICRKR